QPSFDNMYLPHLPADSSFNGPFPSLKATLLGNNTQQRQSSLSSSSSSSSSSTSYHPSQAASNALSQTVLTPSLVTPHLIGFVSTLAFSTWHSTPLRQTAQSPPQSLHAFAQFTSDLLQSTGLQFSVVLLALKLIHRLKSRKPGLTGAEGSECRLLVCALMLAMKTLMDNSFTNKTWSKVAGIPLAEVNVME
ncbi:hypothetical protein HK104_008132, partial [Borealophlyctis nickersoniae]